MSFKETFLYLLGLIGGVVLCYVSVFVPMFLGIFLSPYFYLLFIATVFILPLGIAVICYVTD